MVGNRLNATDPWHDDLASPTESSPAMGKAGADADEQVCFRNEGIDLDQGPSRCAPNRDILP